jgi:hypothetical protein
MTSSFLNNGKGGTFAASIRSEPPGVPGAANGRVYSDGALKGQLFVPRAFLKLFIGEFGLKGVNAGFQRLVFLARQPRHLLGSFEFLALDDIEVP